LETTRKDKPSVSAEEASKRQKKQARREAKLMLAIKEANKELAKGDQDLTRGKHTAGIEHYSHAWKEAKEAGE
jgi:hypothetical protein